MTDLTDKEWILRAVENDRAALIDGIKSLYNCREADVDDEGDIYIADSQCGNWLDDDGLAHVAKALRAGDI